MWLGEVFTELECQAVPALNCRQALVLARRWDLPVRTLVLNPELRGARRLVQVLTAANPGMRVVLICDPGLHYADADRAGISQRAGIPARGILERPAPSDSISREEWVVKVRRMLS